MIIGISIINIIAISILLLGIAIYAIYLVSRKAKEYTKRGRLQKQIIRLTLIFLIGSGLAYMLDVFQYLNGVGFYFHPHHLLPIDVHVDKWENNNYFLYGNDITGQERSKTLWKVTYSSDFSIQARHMVVGTDSVTYLVGGKVPKTVVYHPLQCKKADGTAVRIPMATIVSYGFNKTDFVMQVQDTIGQYHWIKVLPSHYDYYQKITSETLTQEGVRDRLYLVLRYLVLSEEDIPKEHYHWIQLRDLSTTQNVFRVIGRLIWIAWFFILAPIIGLLWIITFVRLLIRHYKQRKTTDQPAVDVS